MTPLSKVKKWKDMNVAIEILKTDETVIISKNRCSFIVCHLIVLY